MFWADRIADEIESRFGKKPKHPLVIRDEKTVSGRVHVGSMRGVVIHGVVSQILAKKGIKNTFLYEFNDLDPMDDLPSDLPKEQFEKYLGAPLLNIPSPEPSAKNYAEYFANDFKSVIKDEGFSPEFYYTSELYTSGKMDEVIREALLAAEHIRNIYKEVSGSQRNDTWLPLSVICPKCGKLSTTEASDFNGETVAFTCRVDKVEWAAGCGETGRISPFGGKAKLPWKVEWGAKWKVLEVSIEGAGKDHSTKGGARDVANRISKEVFKYEPPFDMPYEFFLVGGKKMSSSKGYGSSAREIANLVPPKIFLLAMLSKDIMQAFNFDPEGDTIPVLYDLYDKLAESFKARVVDDYARLFTYIHVGVLLVPDFLMRFSQIAFIVQMPHLNLEEEATRIKGAPLTNEDKKELLERAAYAHRWLDVCAPEKFKFVLQQELPEVAKNLTVPQKQALAKIILYMEAHENVSGKELHEHIHEIKKESGIAAADLFSAIYLLFLGKTSGPQAGWFLSVLKKDFVLKRLKEGVS